MIQKFDKGKLGHIFLKEKIKLEKQIVKMITQVIEFLVCKWYFIIHAFKILSSAYQLIIFIINEILANKVFDFSQTYILIVGDIKLAKWDNRENK